MQDVYRPLVAHEDIELIQGARMRPDGHAIAVIDALTESRVVAIPEEVTNAPTNSYGGEHILRVLIVNKGANAPVTEKRGAELAKSAATSHPSRGNNHAEEPGLQSHGLLHEQIVDRRVVRPTASASHLIRRVPDNHVEQHIASKQLGDPSLDVVRVDECVRMGLKPFTTVQRLFARAAVLAPAVHPRVLKSLEPDIPIITRKRLRNRVTALRVLRAIHTAARQQAREMRDPDPKHLLRQDVVHARLQVRHLLLQPLGEPRRDLPEEHARLCHRVQEPHRRVRPEVRSPIVRRPGLGERIQHPVRERRRREHLVVRKVCDARQDVRVAAAQRKAGLRAHTASPTVTAARSLTVTGGYVLAGVKISCLPRWAKRESSALKADDWVRVSRRKSRLWNLPLPR